MFGQQSSPFGYPFVQPQVQSAFGQPFCAFCQTNFQQQTQPLLGWPHPCTGSLWHTTPAFGATPTPLFGQPVTTQSMFGSKL